MARPRKYVAQGEGVETPPRPVRLTRPFGFIEETHGKGRFYWVAGEVVTNPHTIALLQDRGAPLEVVDE
ncbi:hypothetical protein J2D73_18535 [Acetobacter sacchari]|uniref:Uncharacterized protein n=1 Tax=Acetobacter sacchari TaxID=2661687 RepID=A0ABS3M0T0_9PROT|nr:hypothetical protein [Acetobacter sacchari]MBO1361783.1 hypothetical protein [Acetobacter sacchari]